MAAITPKRNVEYVSPIAVARCLKGDRGNGTLYYSGGMPSTFVPDKQSDPIVKRWDRLNISRDDAEKLRERCINIGVPPPSSWTALAKHWITDKAAPATIRIAFKDACFSPWIWHKALVEISPAVQLDINEAYWSAMARGLPDPRGTRWVDRLSDADVIVADVERDPYLPRPFKGSVPARVVAFREEVETYKVRILKVYRSIAFGRSWNCEDGIYDLIRAFGEDSFALGIGKAVRRTLWGRWLAGKALTRRIGNGSITKEWLSRNPWADPLRAGLVCARVRGSVYRGAISVRGAIRIYVDSITAISEGGNTINSEPGGWRIVRRARSAKTTQAPALVLWGEEIGG